MSLLTKALIILLGISVLALGGEHWMRTSAQADRDKAREDLGTSQARVESLRQSAKLQRELAADLSANDAKRQKEVEDARKTNDALRVAVASGARRLSVKASCPAVRTGGAATATAGQADAEARAELDPASAERIISTGTDGDDAIRELTDLQEYVSTVISKCRVSQ